MPSECTHSPLLRSNGCCVICTDTGIDQATPAPALSAEQAADLLFHTRAELARRKLSAFIKYGWHVLEPSTPLLWNWHIEAVADHAQWLLEEWIRHKHDATHVQRVRDMIVNVPPGSAKSYIITAFAPAWMWLHFPEWRVICLSANPRVLNHMSLRCRELIASEWYQESFKPEWSILDNQDSKTRFANTRGGYRSAVGMEANIVGDRADCVAGATLVATEIGDVRIDRLHQMESPPRVWSYNHTTERVELKRIKATRQIRNREFITVATRAGHSIQCTREHRIWNGAAYEKAEDLAGGTVSVLQRPNQPMARGAIALQQMRTYHTLLYNLPKAVSARRSRTRQTIEAGLDARAFLQQQVQAPRAQPSGVFSRLPGVRRRLSSAESGRETKSSAVLLDAMFQQGQWAKNEDPPRRELRRVRSYDDGPFEPSTLLRQSMPEFGTLSANGRKRQFTLQSSELPRRGVLSDTVFYSRTRRFLLRCMQPNRQLQRRVTGAPYRSQSPQQRAGEPDNALRHVPHHAPQIQESAVASVNTAFHATGQSTIDVYDIQVDENHNFFANGILVHNCLLVDDPHDAYDVQSPRTRQATLDNWDQAVRNRVNEPMHSTRLLIMQRLHEDDLSGHMLEQGVDCHLRLPMEFEPESRCVTALPWRDPRTEAGEILHPARFSRDILAKERLALGSMGYAGQMQQAPAPVEGGMFRRDAWGWCTLEGVSAPNRARPHGSCATEARKIAANRRGGPDLEQIVISVDASVIKDNNDGSRTSILVIGVKGPDRYVLDNITEFAGINEQLPAISALIVKWHPTRILVEKKANGEAIIGLLSREFQGVIGVNPEGGKDARAAAIQPQVEAGNVFLMEGAAWADDFVHELGTFPNGAKDDQVDALSQALIYLNQKGVRMGWLGRL